MESTGHLEIEHKYDVEETTPLPVLEDIPGVERVAEPVRHRLEAVYFDTATLALAARRITLRRRTGGNDSGWHLKLPAGQATRQEIHAPLGQPEHVPAELLAHLFVHTRGADLSPVVRLATERTAYRLYGPGGEHLADFADDTVQAHALDRDGAEVRWREWELELVHGDAILFADAADTIGATGAVPSRHASKPARAMGEAYPPEPVAGTGSPSKKGPVLEVVRAYLDEQIHELLTHDPGVRLGLPKAVHRMRSATRRLRSALAIYGSLFTTDVPTQIEDDLKWLARILGRPRDAEVMRKRLRRRIKELPGKIGNGPVAGPIERELESTYNAGYQTVLKTLETTRYYRLLDELERFRDQPPARPRASRPAKRESARLVNRAAKALEREHRKAAGTKAGPVRDTALHEVRKDAKKLLNAAESVTDIHRKRAPKLVRSAHRLTKVLGEHQDSVATRRFLDSLATDPTLPEGTLRAFRRIQEAEQETARTMKKKYSKAKKKASGMRLRS
ncbi:CHAD domain-containing protein [Paeniglutamicibacter sp. ORCA_105]|uniref:CYTH and CHAD domain-containing protein n=1 Tax=Paeniglutamicibacter sp. ORCA_105 TaxID=3377336 RepID=UPI0038941DE0